jgi:DNA polymerase V
MSTERVTGFASPAQGYEAKGFDFNRILVRNTAATYVMRYESSSMAEKGLVPGCLLVVDRSVKPKPDSLVVFSRGGEFLCREFRQIDRQEEAETFGTVTGVVRTL